MWVDFGAGTLCTDYLRRKEASSACQDGRDDLVAGGDLVECLGELVEFIFGKGVQL